MEILLVMTVGLMCIGCFIVGAKVGQQVAKGETIQTPELNPIKVYQEEKDKRQARWEQSKVETILQNIDAYDGTSRGQQDVPK
jgi:hypothetical protein